MLYLYLQKFTDHNNFYREEGGSTYVCNICNIVHFCKVSQHKDRVNTESLVLNSNN